VFWILVRTFVYSEGVVMLIKGVFNRGFDTIYPMGYTSQSRQTIHDTDVHIFLTPGTRFLDWCRAYFLRSYDR
jgi:hypothetical protein